MSTQGQAADHPGNIHAGLQLLCEDARQGVAPVLAALLNGTQTAPEALKAIGDSLTAMINIGSLDSAKSAFAYDRYPVPPSLVDRPKQRIEWLVLATLVPLLAVPSLAPIHRKLVIRALLVVRHALSLSEDPSTVITNPGLPQRTKAFNQAILSILRDIGMFLNLKDLNFPCDCPIKMSVFKGSTVQEYDPTWMTLRFSSPGDAITVICFLISFLCPESDAGGWPVYRIDEDLRVGLPAVICLLLRTFLPNGAISRQDRNGAPLVATSTASIVQLYQACSHCILETIPWLHVDDRLLPQLGVYLMEILYHHIMTTEERCRDWSAAAVSRIQASKVKLENDFNTPKDPTTPIMSIKECRAEMPAMGVLESLIAKSLITLMESAFEAFPDMTELLEVRWYVVKLLNSEQLRHLSDDESGVNVQRMLMLLSFAFIPSGAFLEPLDAIKHVLSHYEHLELDLLVRFVSSCLEYWRITGSDDEFSDGGVTGQDHSTSSAKRALEDIDYDQSHVSSLDAKGKRVRRESPTSVPPSMESANCSSILSYSQYSQKENKSTYSTEKAGRSPTHQLLAMLGRLVNTHPHSHTASQGSRGIPPPLTINDLKSSVVFIQVWLQFTTDKDSLETGRDTEQLIALTERIGKHYILWALSPGMQNATLNQTYLESSYPLMLDLIAPLCLLELSDSLKILLICLSSGPWFPDLAKPELWCRTETMMDVDDAAGPQQLAKGICEIVESTEILSRLRDNPDILQPCQGFSSQKGKALRIMATLPTCHRLEAWRQHAILNTLKSQTGAHAQDMASEDLLDLKIAAIEALQVLTTHCPDARSMVDPALRSLNLDDEAEEIKMTLASFMGFVACSYSCTNRITKPKYWFDPMHQLYVLNWRCPECDVPIDELVIRPRNTEEASVACLDARFLDSFKRLIPTCVSMKSRSALLNGLYRVLCHLDLSYENLKSLDFGKFILSQLCSPDVHIRNDAGRTAELLSKKAGLTLADDPLAKSDLDDNLGRIFEAISKGFASASRNRTATWPLQLCRQIMRHLPEDHSIYNSLLMKIIDQAFAEEHHIRAGYIFYEFSPIAEDKKMSNYRLIRPQMEYVCAKVIEKLDAGQDRWLDSVFYPWIRMSSTKFIQQNLSELIPKMILLNSPSLIEKLAMVLNEKVTALCIRQIDHILAAIYMQLSEESFQTCIDLLRRLIVQVEQDSGKETQSLDIVELTMLSPEGLVCCLSVELGDEDWSRREKAQMVIEIVEGYYWATQKLEKTRQGKGAEKPQLAVFLRRNILAIMSGVNNAILDRAQVFTLRVKAKYLRSLVTLVRLLNPIQSSVLSQIFPPLLNALDIQGLRIHALGVLNEVVRLVEPGKLDVVLTHLIHTLMKYYPQSNDQERLVGLAILEFLIVDSQEALGSVIPDVGYLLNKPEFELMNQVLVSAKTQHTIEQQLKRLAERSAHENAEIAEQALMELREVLLENEQYVLDLTTTKDQDVAPIVKDLIHALLSGIGRFRGLDAPVPRRCVECLGIIGAVDPAKLSSMRLIPAPPIHTNFSDLEETKNFVCQLIEVQLVGKSRSIGDIHSETELAYTLQTLLSFCGITKDVLESKTPTLPVAPQTRTSTQSSSVSNAAPSKTAEDRWKAFPRHVQEVLELLIDAKYTRAESSLQRIYRSPLYPDAKTFEKWLTLWTQVLIGKVTARYAKDVFQACKHVAQNDTSVCMYILPHLVLDVLVEGTETDRKEIVDEMAAVLGSGKDWREDSSEQAVGVHKQSSSEFIQLSSQTVFALFDHISKWIQLRKNTSTKTAPTPRSYTIPIDLSQTKARNQDQTLSVVQAHLTSISQEVIAVSAFGCKAYARSLLHYEQHIRDARQQRGASDLDTQAMYERLQKIYVHMEEPDGMDGISNLIQSDSETQNLLQCESAARWSEAQTYYELGMETDPEKFENHAGLYKCLDNLGHFDTLFSTVEGDIHVYPDWELSLQDWRVATAWKVQRWQSLEMAISRSVQPSFETGLGQLILDMRENRVIDFEEHLRQVRSMLIPPLAAASMESYTRSYEPIVQLAMLHELEVGSKGWSRSVSSNNILDLRVATMPDGDSYVERLRKYRLTLDKRIDSMAPSFRLREQVSRLRRVAFYDLRIPAIVSHDDLSYLKETCGRLWLDTARAARKSGSSQISYSAMLHAEGLRDGSTTIERAKWEFIHKSERQAISSINAVLKHSLASPASSSAIATRALTHSVNRQRQISSNGRRTAIFNTELQRVQDRIIDKNDIGFIRAKAHILRTRWMEKNNLVSPADIVEGYRQATVECDRWEKGYYVAGQYYLKLYENSRRYKNRSPALGHVTSACRLYGKALTLGPKYLYQALPRLLTFWLELGHQATLRSEKNDAFMNSVCAEFQNVNTLMEGLAGYLPEYMFLSAFPQIISRICHKNPDAFAVLQHIIVNVVMAFPDQAIWQMVSVSRSIVPERKRVCNKILDSINLQPRIGSAIVDQIKEALDLCDNLIALCMAPVPDKVDKLSLERHFPKTYSQLRQHYNVTVPGHRTLWPTVPESSATVASHQPFKSNLPKINRFLDEVDVMSSLQRPRKITIVGSDGLHYTFLCKPKDDLRKDAKVMEFNNLVNMLLRKDREAHRRNLYIRTYAVVPLNEECGLIEWVHNTVPFRHIMQKLYKINSINLINILDIKRILDQEDNAKIFVKDLLPKFPPIFYQWFIDISAEPTAWFEARLRYTRTTAVMSMVGHIMGLGDRHGENLLFDNRNGDIVHVDFNCLFEQGKTFPKPEKVPFRLTQNMVDAMGLSGYDGVYRLACERTLQVFRDNTESLVSVLEGFIHDPLVEWSKSKRRGQQVQQEAGRVGVAAAGLFDPAGAEDGGGAEESRARLRSRAEAKAKADAAAAAEAADTQQNEKAQTILTIIKRKLSGTENANPYVLSVQGQVEELIQAATSPENLGKMYIGWSAYL